MKIYHSTQFGTAPHTLLYSDKISFKAKGLYTYMQAKPDGWEFSADRISEECKEGREAIQSGLLELIDNDWLIRTKRKDAKGQWEWTHILVSHASEIPGLEKPESENPTTENPTTNKEIDIKKENSFSTKNVILPNDEPVEEEIQLVDEDGNPIQQKVPKARKDPLLDHFTLLSIKNIGSAPVIARVAALTLLKSARQHLNDAQIKDMFEEWFGLGKPDNETIQITRALSTVRINQYKVMNGIK